MTQSKPPFTVVQGAGGSVPASSPGVSPAIPPLAELDTSERRIWKYICDSLADAGLEYVTAGLPIAIIVKTYSAWIAALKECGEKGRSQLSANGWASETPWAADERRLKSELGQWLPKACLTIPSLTRVRKEMGINGAQDDLFGDLVAHAKERPSAQG